MSTTLIQNVNNSFYERRNALTAREGEITALVEDYEDEFLWKVILSTVHPEKRFRLIPYQTGANLTQSKNLIVQEIREKGGSLYIGCLDADQSFLLRNHGNSIGRDLEQIRYLFHTYAYSRENLLCMPSTLAQVFTAATSLQTPFLFEEFFCQLSGVIYPLFVLDLFMRSVGGEVRINVDKWKNILPGKKLIEASIRTTAPESILNQVRKNVVKSVAKLQSSPKYEAHEFSRFEQELLACNSYLNQDNCCLFVYGHEMIAFVSALLESLKDKELQAEISRIGSLVRDPSVRQEKIDHLRNVQKDFDTILAANYGFIQQNALLYQLVRKDVLAL